MPKPACRTMVFHLQAVSPDEKGLPLHPGVPCNAYRTAGRLTSNGVERTSQADL
jgi:hypothetical protein